MRVLPSNRGAGSTSGTPIRALAARIWSVGLVGSLRVVAAVQVVQVVTIRRAVPPAPVSRPVPAPVPVRTDPQ
ncbi:MAG: hypothetical protein JO296_12215 [Pseudonocardiales bacterium]|nr:hypothetical protein [Pseudonocardiales bacterium]MBV9650890.1 hypothetical protein [Pseudonocardiales bacterium]